MAATRVFPMCVQPKRSDRNPNIFCTMVPDSLDELPPDSRREIVASVRETLGVDELIAEDLIRASEPLWEAMERAGGLVDSWGGGEYSWVFPRVLAYIRSTTTSG